VLAVRAEALDAGAGNLPIQISSFAGRADELAELDSAMRRSSLVTVVGVGGVGKTGLALHAAAGQLPSFGDGAWLCELDAAEDAEAMTGRRGRAAGASPAGHLHGRQHRRALAYQERAAAGARQLRASADRGGCPRSGHPAQLPGSAHLGHEPTAARRGR
jgi:hypothetical protein